jgi:hypothetical protein
VVGELNERDERQAAGEDSLRPPAFALAVADLGEGVRLVLETPGTRNVK